MMKQEVKLSTFSIITTWMCMIVLVALSVYSYRDGAHWLAYSIGILLIIMITGAFFYMPLSISVDSKKVTVNFMLRRKHIPLNDIDSVKPCPPTMAEHRICGSGGWYGYWGWFSEPSIGKYFAYYGKASDCFLVELKHRKKYMLGCKNPTQMVEYINSQL